MNEKIYKFGKSKLILRFGDITTTDSQVIVSSDDYYLSMGGGVSAAILQVGGNEIALDAAKKVPAKLGDVVITTAGRLKSKFIFHAITIGNHREKNDSKKVIESTTIKCLSLLDSLDIDSISFPAIGSGAANFNYEEVAVEMANVISEYLQNSPKERIVTIYLFDRFGKMQPIDYVVFFEAFATRSPHIAEKEIKKEIDKSVKKEELLNISSKDTEQEIKAKRLHNLRSILGSLEDQRNRLEEKLINLLEKDSSEEYQKIEGKLKENEKLRISRLKELKDLTEDNLSIESKSEVQSVFLSSTYLDLIEYRKAVIEQIIKRKLIFIGMEHFGANHENHPPANIIINEVKKADIYIGIFGVRYGHIDEATGISMTELEYREAKSSNKPMLLYVIKDSASVRVCDIEQDNIAREKLKALTNEILKNKMVYMFDTAESLASQIYADLEKIIK